MSNKRTLRRLARTGDPVLLTVAGHRARAVPPSPPPGPVVHTFQYNYYSAGNLTGASSWTDLPCAGPDSAAEATETVTYAGYPDALADSNLSASDRYSFTGRELDSVTGLQHNGARSFDPTPGRWSTQQPLDPDPSDPVGQPTRPGIAS
jgi:RHS repeat-associated protein